MKLRSHVLVMSLLMASFTSVSAAESPTLGQQLDSAITAIQEFTLDKKDKTLTQVESTLGKLDTRIEQLEKALEEKWDSMDATTRQEARHSLQVLHEKRTKMAQWLGSMQQSTSTAWSKVKDGFSQAYSALEETWQDDEPPANSDSNVKQISI